MTPLPVTWSCTGTLTLKKPLSNTVRERGGTPVSRSELTAPGNAQSHEPFKKRSGRDANPTLIAKSYFFVQFTLGEPH